MQKIDRNYFLNQIDQYVHGGEEDSTVSTKYIYERLHDALMVAFIEDVPYKISRLMDELAHNYTVDTGRKIGEDL